MDLQDKSSNDKNCFVDSVGPDKKRNLYIMSGKFQDKNEPRV